MAFVREALAMKLRHQWTLIYRLRAQAAEHKNILSAAVMTVAGLLVFEFYVLRELLAAELLFGLAFAVLSSLAAMFYLIGVACERGFDRTETHVHFLIGSVRRTVNLLEMPTAKAFVHQHRHPESGSTGTS